MLLVCAAGAAASAQTGDAPDAPGPIYHVFLKDGRAIPCYGEPSDTAGHVVFNLVVDPDAAPPEVRLVSLPADAVDRDRTTRYTEAMRAAQYAATRGEADYAAMSEEVARTLGQLQTVADPARRRALAAIARERLLDWSRAHYAYRARDIQQLAGLFDTAAEDARVGDGAISLDLVAGPAVPAREPLRAAPDLRESIELALAAAAAADSPEERMAVLRAVEDRAGAAAPDLARRAADLAAAERRSAEAYAALEARTRARVASARRAGDVAALERLDREVLDEDARLGARRPRDLAALRGEIAAALDAARTYRLALDHYAYVKPALLRYEHRLRPALALLDGSTPLLTAVREMHGVRYEDLRRAAERLARMVEALAAMSVPDDLASVHASVSSAMSLARDACERRAQAVVTNNVQTAREASSAAAGALLLAGAAREDLVAALFPPEAP